VVNNSDDLWAGMFWPNTKAALIQELYKYKFSQSFQEEDYSEDVIQALKKSSIL
jgi:hypothetical protein